jgi:uncharacterized protein involved in response to NO
MAVLQINTNKPIPPDRFSLFALGFRPFFLLAGLAALLLMANWVSGFISGESISTFYPATSWHSHEMIYGYASAVIAGFLLTSVYNWTGVQTATGGRLILLALLWLAGRLLPLMPFASERWLAVVDLSFLPLLALAIAFPIIRARQWRNVMFVPLLLLLAGGNALFHMGVAHWLAYGISLGIQVGLAVVVMMIVIMAGRVVGFFIERGLGETVRRWSWAEVLAIGGSLVFLLAQFFVQGQVLAAIAWVAALGHLGRLLGWYRPGIWRVPLLWVLYLGYVWIFMGFVLMGLAPLELPGGSVAIHAFTAGAIGVMTLGMMARVSLGHTGRQMHSHRLTDLAFLLVNLAAVARVFLPLAAPVMLLTAIKLAGVLWALAFTLYLVVYAPMLMRARVDGMPG